MNTFLTKDIHLLTHQTANLATSQQHFCQPFALLKLRANLESMCLALHHHDRVIGFDCFGSVVSQAAEACKDYDNVFVQQANLFNIDVLPSATHLFCTTLGLDPSTCLHVLY